MSPATTNNDSATVADTIAKADPVCTVTGYSVIFDLFWHTATARVSASW